MKPFELLAMGGQGWRVVVDELMVTTRVGLYEHEHRAPQPVAIDASLRYRSTPHESTDGLIDYEAWCDRVSAFLETKPHTRLLETLAMEIAAFSFDEWPALDGLTLALHKPKIREGTRRLALELDWRRADFDAWRAQNAAALQAS
ncbi:MULTISPECIES: dihydroneopterin aldolase [unclassified Caballeronia]|uniref:dihydroneopterin aldolase n=1 Tax=unclassified Caballeronia TaxID=2646786 RepID=UPI00285CE0A9|nr:MULTISPECIES: dihydroneopterin aldolase [unclassified Caballeronia]MDR5776137.1 dihydroneopterin aldolase [Caballeronia sp. LZ002]MDR5851577.1 dihydroneopterin aldolase [Caballeronia sp. LZ003]